MVKRGNQFHARRRRGGIDEYGPARATQDEAEADRLAWLRDTRPAQKAREIPILAEFAFDLIGEDAKGRYAQTLARTSLDTAETIRLRHLNPSPLAMMRIDRIRRADVQRWVDSLTATKRRRDQSGESTETRHPASPATKRRSHAYLAKVLQFAVLDGHLATNPARMVSLPPVEERENRILEPEEASQLLRPQTRTDVAILIGLHGLRRSEVLRLRWSDWDGARLRVTQRKGRKGFRWVDVMPELREALNRLERTGPTILATESGRPLSARNLYRDWRKRAEELGLPRDLRFQDLRGTLVTLLLDRGTSLRAVMDLVGHTNPKTTLKAYARTRDKARSEAIEGLGDQLRGSGSGAVTGSSEPHIGAVDASSEPGKMVGGTGLEPVTPTVSLSPIQVRRTRKRVAG